MSGSVPWDSRRCHAARRPEITGLFPSHGVALRLLCEAAMHCRFSAKVPMLATLAGLLFALPVGCDEEEPPIERRLCERFDGCNFFAAGLDVDDCSDIMTMCTDSLLGSVRSDWERDAERALENSNCVNFLADYQLSDVCYIRDDGSIAGAPDSGDDGPAPQESCGEDYTACTGPNSIEACLDGQYLALDCDDVCDEGELADGCAYDDELGRDVCYCVTETEDPTGPAPPPGG
jgi:hypothetical protein